MRSELFFTSAVFTLLINTVRSDGFIPYKVSEHRVGVDGICAGIQIVILPHPDPTLCHMFVVCMFEQPTVYECLKGYVYDSDLLSCVPGEREQCLGSSGPNWQEICANVSYAVYSDPNVCWEFVFCSYGMVNRFTCPTGEIWSQQDVACLPGNLNTCELLDLMNTCQNLPDGVLPHPNECSQYLKCSLGVTTIVDCLQGEVFNSILGRCVIGNTETCTPLENICNGRLDADRVQHPNKCDLFINCRNGVPVLTECPANEIFNVHVKTCAPGDAHTCQFFPMDTVCKDKANGTKIPFPDRCDQYAACQKGEPITWTCVEGKILHGASGTCRPGNRETCEFLVYDCVNKPVGAVIEHPNFCQVYIRCLQYQTVSVVACPPGEILRPDAQVCVPGMPFACTFDPIERMCSGRPDGRVYPHPTDCRSFIRCQTSRPVVENCPAGNVFHAMTQTCIAGNGNTCSLLNDTCASRPDGVLPHPQGCDLFLECISGTTTAFRCPDGEILHPLFLECVKGNSETCTLSPVTTKAPIAVSCKNRPDGFYPHPEKCYALLECLSGDALLWQCPPKMIFNAAIEGCEPGNWETCIFG